MLKKALFKLPLHSIIIFNSIKKIYLLDKFDYEKGDKVKLEKEFEKLIDNFYEVERIVGTLEKNPRSYNTDHLVYYNEAHTLKMIAENEGTNQQELSHKMMRTKGATSVMVEKLVKKGFLEKRLGEKDQRSSTLYLTDSGWELHEYHKKYDENRLNGWIHGMDLNLEDLEIANKVIAKAIGYYKKEIYRDGAGLPPEKITI